MRRIAVINQKGGVGKTTTAANLGAALAAAGQRVLLIDLDPQSHLTLHVGLDPATRAGGTYEALIQSTPLDRVRRQVADNLWIVGSHIDLAAAEVELVSVIGREVILRDLLEAHATEYDYVIMDCPPSLGVLTLNALAAAGEIFIPLQPHYLALHGLSKLLETVSLVARRINPALRVTGVVVCMHEPGTRLATEVLDDVASFLRTSEQSNEPWAGARVFKTLIRRNIKLAECPSHGMTIFTYAPKSNGADDYAALALEVRAMVEPGIVTQAAPEPASSKTCTPPPRPRTPRAKQPPPPSLASAPAVTLAPAKSAARFKATPGPIGSPGEIAGAATAKPTPVRSHRSPALVADDGKGVKSPARATAAPVVAMAEPASRASKKVAPHASAVASAPSSPVRGPADVVAERPKPAVVIPPPVTVMADSTAGPAPAASEAGSPKLVSRVGSRRARAESSGVTASSEASLPAGPSAGDGKPIVCKGQQAASRKRAGEGDSMTASSPRRPKAESLRPVAGAGNVEPAAPPDGLLSQTA